jgi:3-oxoacyl-[acyl-carrier-protein] synthase II
MKAVYALFGANAKVKISATKSAIGHLLGGAGAIEALICIKAIETSIIPPTINTKDLDPALPQGLNIVLDKAVHQSVNVAMSNTFGFGGHNATAVFKKV